MVNLLFIFWMKKIGNRKRRKLQELADSSKQFKCHAIGISLISPLGQKCASWWANV